LPRACPTNMQGAMMHAETVTEHLPKMDGFG
jgi:hypothetical protein